jgi:hypothetical protein
MSSFLPSPLGAQRGKARVPGSFWPASRGGYLDPLTPLAREVPGLRLQGVAVGHEGINFLVSNSSYPKCKATPLSLERGSLSLSLFLPPS